MYFLYITYSVLHLLIILHVISRYIELYFIYTNVFLVVQIYCAKTRNTKTLHFTTKFMVVYVRIQGSQAILPTKKRNNSRERKYSHWCFKITSYQSIPQSLAIIISGFLFVAASNNSFNFHFISFLFVFILFCLLVRKQTFSMIMNIKFQVFFPMWTVFRLIILQFPGHVLRYRTTTIVERDASLLHDANTIVCSTVTPHCWIVNVDREKKSWILLIFLAGLPEYPLNAEISGTMDRRSGRFLIMQQICTVSDQWTKISDWTNEIKQRN